MAHAPKRNKIYMLCIPKRWENNSKVGARLCPYLHMRIQGARLWESLSASNANVWTFSWMNSHMPQQNCIHSKSPSAYRTDVWSLSCMIPHVILQLHYRCKPFLTYWTFDRFLRTVKTFMAGQVTWLSKGLAAKVTNKRTLVCVRPHVYFQASLGNITVLADFARKRALTYDNNTYHLVIFQSQNLPVWVRRCNSRLNRCGKLLPHILHRNGRSPVCCFMWTSSDCASGYSTLQ